jgi:uncharacterized membrane protein YhaH (DUF805 family)
MPNFLSLLLSFKGRIGRASWWLGFVITVIGNIIGVVLFDKTLFDRDAPANSPPGTADTIWQLLMVVPLTAITVKRFNDRDYPPWTGYAFSTLSVWMAGAPYFGIDLSPQSPGVQKVLFWLLSIAGLFVFVENGFMRGTDGPNRYGPDPLARQS